MATLPALMTVEQFQELPLDRGPVVHELHHGEVVTLTRPKAKHYMLQTRLADLLRTRAEHLGVVGIEMPFRAVPQFDLRAADVAFVSRKRWDSIDLEDNLRGAPDLVIEVKSASNTWAELREQASLCLANGCQDFWIVDEMTRTITAITPDGKAVQYSGAECVPLPLFGGDGLSNFVAWYTYLKHLPSQGAALLESLRDVLDGFVDLKLWRVAGANVLGAQFSNQGGPVTEFRFNELSEGQRCLICLYAILVFVLAQGNTVLLDEPDNFISLREIQPWLMTATDVVENGHGQLLLISHHPEIIDQWAAESAVRFVRDGSGPVRVEEFPDDPESALSPAELIARGWESG